MNSLTFALNSRSESETHSSIARSNNLRMAFCATAFCALALLTTNAAFASESESSKAGLKIAPGITVEENAAQHGDVHFAAIVPLDDQSDAAVMPEGQGSADALLNPERYFALTPDSVSEGSYYGTWTDYPFVRRFLVSFVAYNSKCQWISSGTWTEGSIAPKYGVVTQSYVWGKLSNGACPGWVFKGRGIYYEWVYKTGVTHNDKFKANWHGGGLTNYVTFYIKDK